MQAGDALMSIGLKVGTVPANLTVPVTLAAVAGSTGGAGGAGATLLPVFPQPIETNTNAKKTSRKVRIVFIEVNHRLIFLRKSRHEGTILAALITPAIASGKPP